MGLFKSNYELEREKRYEDRKVRVFLGIRKQPSMEDKR